MKRKTCSSELCIISAPPIPDLSPCIGPFKETAAILGQGFRSSLKQGFLGFGWLVFLFFRRLLYDLDMTVAKRAVVTQRHGSFNLCPTYGSAEEYAA